MDKIRRDKIVFLTGTHLYFLVTAIMAVIFFRERIAADAAYYLLQVVDSENFRIEHQRFILGASQALPLLGVKIGLSLKAVMILNSLNPVIFFYGLFLYAVFFLRDKTAGVALILVQTLGVLHMYFCPMYEIWYGTALLVLIYSHLRQNRHRRWLDIVLLLLLMITALFSHPLVFIPLLFLILFDAFEKWWVIWRQLLLYALLFCGWYIAKKMLLTDYETGKMSLLNIGENKSYENLFHFSYLWMLAKYLMTYYTVPLLLFLFTVSFCIVRKTWIRASLLTAFFFGIIVLINVTHESGSFQTLYFERMYMPLVTIALLPFMYDIFTQLTLRNITGGILVALIVCWRLWLFVDTGKTYTADAALKTKLINTAQQEGGSKFMMADADFAACFKYADWSLPMETLLCSALDGKDKCVTIVTREDLDSENNRQKLNETNFLFRRWDLRMNEEVNPEYFLVKPGNYVELGAVCK
ncbi:MAG: hypothetical protein FD123_1250 [Bacteroidetes bacterium]|nr:MAG: hypothetical protein FD123_1250 [Bacteroidota bacterium]